MQKGLRGPRRRENRLWGAERKKERKNGVHIQLVNNTESPVFKFRLKCFALNGVKMQGSRQRDLSWALLL